MHFNNAGEAHALTFSCHNRVPLLDKDRCRVWLLNAFAQACDRHAMQCLAWVIMPEHAHILVLPKDTGYDISRFLQSVKQPVSIRAKRWLTEYDSAWLEKLSHTDAQGKVRFRFWLQGGGYDRNIRSDKALRQTIAYIHNNPVRRNFAQEPTAWLWSSARWYAEGCTGSIFEHAQPPDLWS